jgi:hypothetical protein
MARGWISARFMRSRAKWGAPMSEEKRRAPLRRITYVIRHRAHMFEADRVVLECGHEADAWGDQRARCIACGGDSS